MRTPGHYGRRRGRALAAVAVLVVAGAAVFVSSGFDPAPAADAGTSAQGEAITAGSAPTVDDVLDSGVVNADGSVTVVLDDSATTSLVSSALARVPSRRLRDVTIELVAPDDGAGGQMELRGRLRDLAVPVSATVDLEVVDARVRPTLRGVRVGPLALGADAERDLNREIRALALVADDQFAVDDLRTTDGELVLTGRPD